MSLFPYSAHPMIRLLRDPMRELQTLDRMFDLRRCPYFSDCRLRNTTDFGAGVGQLIDDENRFAVTLDVSHFRPDELQVNIDDNTLIIEGHHEEMADEQGRIERHFVRKYTLPDDVLPEAIMSELSVDGKLTIAAPKKHAIDTSTRRSIPIQQARREAVRESGETGFGGKQVPIQQQQQQQQLPKQQQQATLASG